MPAKAFIAGRLPVRRGLDENEAAVYLSLSPSFFRKLVEDNGIPRPRIAGGRRIGTSKSWTSRSRRYRDEGGEAEVIFASESDSWADFK